jgi:hypothetical protein
LLDVDDSKLSSDDLKAISKHLPTSEELVRIQDFGDVSKLAKADQFLHHVCICPSHCQRWALMNSGRSDLFLG